MSKSALYGRAPPVRSRRHVRIRRGFGPCLQPRTAGALPWQRPRDREPWVRIACVRPFTPSVIKSGLVVSRDTETEGTGIDEAYELRRVVLLTAGEREDERVAFAISTQMDFCTEPSSAAAERAESPFFPPAACWWARITVLSMQCISQSSNPRPSAWVCSALK